MTVNSNSPNPNPLVPHESPPQRRLPRLVFAVVGGALASVVVVGWIAFGGSGDTIMTMILASVFAVVALGIPIFLARTSRGRIDDANDPDTQSWLRGQFETLTGRLSGRTAAIQILLPVMAVAIGFALIALDLALVRMM